MKKLIATLIKFIIKKIFFICGLFTQKKYIFFVPHPGMCKIDLYDIINYKSDSALSFLHYLLSHKKLTNKTFVVATRDNVNTEMYVKYVEKNFPEYNVLYIPIHANNSYSTFQQLKRFVEFCRITSKCSHIFTSITYDFSNLISSQVVVDLNYFTCAMKNDILDRESPHYNGIEKVGHEYKYIIGTSEFAIRLTMPEMTLPYRKYVNIGLCRNDNLLNGERCEWLRNEIQSHVTFKVNTIVLYTPTHRDYESRLTGTDRRSILGFDYSPSELESFLRSHGIVFICKLHPKQNALVVESDLPEGLILHKPDSRYGLTELMQASDALMTDYTSVYFDYLLLDKPIIFNFYDLDVYKRERGVPCEPMSAISAGEIVNNINEMMHALLNLEVNLHNYASMRLFVRNLFFTQQDNKTCSRVYNFIFPDETLINISSHK